MESLLQTATDYLSDPQDYEAIADTLYNVDTDYVQNSATDAYKQLYNKLMELVGSQVAEQMYREYVTVMSRCLQEKDDEQKTLHCS